MQFSNVCLHTFGYQLPPIVLHSEEIEHRLEPLYKRLKLPAGRLELMSGIQTRRLWQPGTRPSLAATLAGKKVLERGEIPAESIECLFFTSVSRDMMEPATASFVHHGLGLSEDCLVFDLSNACLGFLNGMVTLASMIEQGQVDNGLLVAGETAEELVESTFDYLLSDIALTRKSIKPAFASLTIGSGSVGLFMCRADLVPEKPRLAHAAWKADTSHSNLCQGDSLGTGTTLMATDSEELLVRGVETAKKTWEKFSSVEGWGSKDINRFFCHQVGSAHARLLFQNLQLDPDKNFETLKKLGNVGSVSAPITMAMAIDEGKFQPGQKGALLGIGSGINCLMLGVNWKQEERE